MAEEFPSFDLGFDFLNEQNNEEAGNFPGEAATGQKRFADVTETEKNQLFLEVQAKATKSATYWAVNALKGKETQSLTCNEKLMLIN